MVGSQRAPEVVSLPVRAEEHQQAPEVECPRAQVAAFRLARAEVCQLVPAEDYLPVLVEAFLLVRVAGFLPAPVAVCLPDQEECRRRSYKSVNHQNRLSPRPA
ncbi:hypothetical protein FHR96_000185 [Halomonas organivorans]|uniref:Uncharacterized protein n=1 Tax=Halomonas organivorans TaxID=257772 RepID=A0A7W5G3R4_9GAMM|nr:hypothetical protein [Halomonas organivorans]